MKNTTKILSSYRQLAMKKIVDYFPFFNEKELLELRLNLLKDYVDEFVIVESSHNHTGHKKDFICKDLIKEFDFENQVTVIEIDYDKINLTPEEVDYYDAREAKNSGRELYWTRDRLQKDGLLNIIDKYDDDTVFISSDCDEIINPEFVEYFSNVCRGLNSNYLKVPLVLLEGRADKRLFVDDTPADWSKSLVLCTAKQIKDGGSPSKFRGQYKCHISPVWVTQDNKVIQDCGWHFTWMGKERRNEKAKSFVHHGNLSEVNTLSVESFKQIVKDDKLVEEYKNKCNYVLKNYPLESLPQIIFKLPRVKEFLLPQEKNIETGLNFGISSNTKSTTWMVDNFYENPDSIRKFALEQDYHIGGIGRGYIGNRTHQQFLFPGLKERFEQIMGKKITKWKEHGMNGRFQYCWSGQPIVYHCDSQMWGGMLYLSPNAPFECGTTLYAHKKTRARTYNEEGYDASWKDIPGDYHLDGTPFEPVDVLGNVYNRLVIFDASCIHSASKYFGTVKDNSRLWQMFFFDTEN
jgi:hypothetical protein